MVSENSRLRVFVSYSHQDRRWLERLNVHLTPLVKDYDLDCWDDTKLTPGSKWREKIRAAIDKIDAAILIISADFLASEFIRSNELPPLLKAAEEEGALILPLIASPCLFLRHKELCQFQAVNFVSNPLVMASRGEQENAFLKVAETLLDKIESRHLAPTALPAIMAYDHAIPEIGENFFDHKTWTRLIKIGDWIYDVDKQRIIGVGVRNYLLSREEYGEIPFRLEAHLEFSNFVPPKDDKKLLGMNAGILLGWKSEKEASRYYNILLTGANLLVERVGFEGGEDAKHITAAVPLEIKPHASYVFEVLVDSQKIKILLNAVTVCELPRPTGVVGRVGLRPWRSQIDCTKFIVRHNL